VILLLRAAPSPSSEHHRLMPLSERGTGGSSKNAARRDLASDEEVEEVFRRYRA
jgi:hypothetical protein